jgi:AraC-like DNA-binding protein
MAYLRSNPSTSMSAGELARFSGMSRRSFENTVLAEYGRSPGILLQEMRQVRAEKLLSESELTIAEIGSECGYQEPSVFSTAFKRWTGKSPRDFRRLHRLS